MDFEAVLPAIPIFKGTSPYDNIPFQWSMHTMRSAGDIIHAEYLHQERTDPRLPFLETLLEALDGDTAPIFVYSGYEKRMLNNLARQYPTREREIKDIVDRLVDLEELVRKYVAHPACYGSSSLKSVLPAFVPSLSYDGLAIQEGQTAAMEYEAFARGESDGCEKALFLIYVNTAKKILMGFSCCF